MTGTRLGKQLEIEQNVDFTIAKHALRAGVLVNGGWRDSNQQSNANGTYTFSSLQDYLAGLARTYSRRVGDPDVSYSQFDAGGRAGRLPAQEPLRQPRSAPGTADEDLDDGMNLAPRVAATDGEEEHHPFGLRHLL